MSDIKKEIETETVESEERRKALRAIGKYATLGAGASVVLLSSAEAVKAQSGSIYRY
ncbi:hypothetical protein [Tropicibacter oceani]|uniref:Uncharacterized protein n=1 Tax=Tropicibacter oceani TaxID=3058420 RepID=A0ABY8QFM6_9RHOB|nr:hypothetical protein [Tropicibacter oceani]WGW03309.1 hypothetical protein QF118_15460 [Tropicibacter oceani]